MSAASEFRAAAAERVLVKDGAYGTLIQGEGLKEADYRGDLALNHDQRGNNDLLNLTQPDIVRKIAEQLRRVRRRYPRHQHLQCQPHQPVRLWRGKPACLTSIGRRRGSSARWSSEASEGRQAALGGGGDRPDQQDAVAVARRQRPGYREVTFEEVKSVYREQIDALVEGGIDFVLIETVFDTLNCKAAIMAALEAEAALGRELPIMISMTLTDLSGRNLCGHTVEGFWASVRHARPLTIGLNCSFGAAQLRPHLAALAHKAETLVMAYPNAGLAQRAWLL